MTGTDEIFDSKADIRTDEGEILAAADAARARVNRLLEYLDPRTRDVIRMRGGLDGSQEDDPRTDWPTLWHHQGACPSNQRPRHEATPRLRRSRRR